MNDEANIPAVIEISLEDFDHHNPQRSDSLKHGHHECQWFVTADETLLGVLHVDRHHGDLWLTLFGRDKDGVCREVAVEDTIDSTEYIVRTMFGIAYGGEAGF